MACCVVNDHLYTKNYQLKPSRVGDHAVTPRKSNFPVLQGGPQRLQRRGRQFGTLVHLTELCDAFKALTSNDTSHTCRRNCVCSERQQDGYTAILIYVPVRLYLREARSTKVGRLIELTPCAIWNSGSSWMFGRGGTAIVSLA